MGTTGDNYILVHDIMRLTLQGDSIYAIINIHNFGAVMYTSVTFQLKLNIVVENRVVIVGITY